MAETILMAIERTKQGKRFQEAGFIPGVLYGDGLTGSLSVKFEESALKKLIAEHGSNAKVWVKYGKNKKFGFIKEVQRKPVSGKVIHIDVMLVAKDHEIRMQLPINFKGQDNLEQRRLLLQVYKSEIDVLGKAALMPDVVVVDVAGKDQGDTITLNDFQLDKRIKIQDREDEIYGIIAHLREQTVEEATET